MAAASSRPVLSGPVSLVQLQPPSPLHGEVSELGVRTLPPACPGPGAQSSELRPGSSFFLPLEMQATASWAPQASGQPLGPPEGQRPGPLPRAAFLTLPSLSLPRPACVGLGLFLVPWVTAAGGSASTSACDLLKGRDSTLHSLQTGKLRLGEQVRHLRFSTRLPPSHPSGLHIGVAPTPTPQ